MNSTTSAALGSKHEQVRTLFNMPEKYLGPRGFDIQIRTETVQDFTAGMKFNQVLDIGCGSGAISLPLLAQTRKMTLLDISSRMLDIARSKVPSDRTVDVELINGEFMAVDLAPRSFDLVCCIGVLAHVDSPGEVIAKVSGLVKPGGMVILEFTDSYHFWGIPVVIYQKLLRLFRPEPYPLNRVTRRQVMGYCKKSSLASTCGFRYGLPPLGSNKILTQDQMYRATRFIFGPFHHNRNAWMGNQFLCRLQANDFAAPSDNSNR